MQSLAENETWRVRWQLATLLLALASFACLHEQAFEGQLARQCRGMAAGLLSRYLQTSPETTPQSEEADDTQLASAAAISQAGVQAIKLETQETAEAPELRPLPG